MSPVALVHTEKRKQLAHLAPVDAQAKLIDMWLYGKAKNTQESYRLNATRFLAFVAKPLVQVSLEDLYDFAKYLDESDLTPSAQKTALAVVKSLLSFAHKIGFVPFNVGAALTLTKTPDTLNERLLSEVDVAIMIRLEPNVRNRCLLRLLYGAGLRASEVCNLKWKNLATRGDAGQVTVVGGKGNKSRSILLPKILWDDLMSLRGNALDNDPVFKSRKKGGHIQRQNLQPIIKKAAARAGLSDKVSTHWLRHAHASHALERGANIGLVQETLGHDNVSTTSRYLHARPNDSSAMYLPL